MKIAFYFTTKGANAEETLAYKSLSRLNDIDVYYDANNKEGLSVMYNSILKEHLNDFDFTLTILVSVIN